ncbi:MAG: cupin domain-containing protein [Lentisphaeria bacterium]|nr:MAG: cupin domain-containing protein [Lentisphaeria bacterium]
MTDTPFTLPELHLADADRGRSEEWFLPALDAFLRQGSRTILPRSEGMWEKIPGSAYHLEPELFLQLQGGCEFRFPRQTVLLRRGDLLLIPPGLPMRSGATTATALRSRTSC